MLDLRRAITRGWVLIPMALVGAHAWAGTLAVDPAASNADLTLSMEILGVPLTAQEQFPGSFSTTYGGSLEASFLDSAVGFLGGGGADADLQPQDVSPAVGGAPGLAPGDYGVRVDETVDTVVPPFDVPGVGLVNVGTLHTVFADVAARDIVLDVVPGADIPLAAGAFDASQVAFSFTGSLDIYTEAVVQPADFVACLGIAVAAPQLEADYAEYGLDLTANCFASTIIIEASFNRPLDGALALPNEEVAGAVAAAGGVTQLVLPIGFEIGLADLDVPPDFAGLFDLTFGLQGGLLAEGPTECSDGIDNDLDGLIDDGDDPGCSGPDDISERSDLLPCDDGVDNDGDGGIDFDPATFASPGDSTTAPAGIGDPGCKDPEWHTENPLCQNGEDDDGDGKADYDGGFNGPPGSSLAGVAGLAGDKQCLGKPFKDREVRANPPCGLGFELALLLPGLMRLRRRSRQA